MASGSGGNQQITFTIRAIASDFLKVLSGLGSAAKAASMAVVKAMGAASAAAKKLADAIGGSVGRIKDLAKTAAGIALSGGVGFGLISAGADQAADDILAIGRAARALNVPIRDMGELAHAARTLDMDLGDMTGAISGLSGLASQALQDSSSEIAKAFASVGVTYGEMAGEIQRGNERIKVPGAARNTAAIFRDLVATLKGMPDNDQRRGLIQQFFGGSEEMVRRFLDAGPGALSAMRSDAAGLGRVFSRDQVQAAEAYHVAVNRLQEAFRGLISEISVQLMPRLAKGLGWMTDFVARNRTLIADVIGRAFDFLSDAFDDIVNMLDGHPELVKNGWLGSLSGVLKVVGYWAKEVFGLLMGPGRQAGITLTSDGKQFISTMQGAPGALTPALTLLREIRDVLSGDEGRATNSWVVRNIDALRNIRSFGLRVVGVFRDLFALAAGADSQVRNEWVKQLWDIAGRLLRVVKEVSASLLGIKLDGELLPASKMLSGWIGTAAKAAGELFSALTGGTPETAWAQSLQRFLSEAAGSLLDCLGVLVGMNAKTAWGKALAGHMADAYKIAKDIYKVLFEDSLGETSAGEALSDAIFEAKASAVDLMGILVTALDAILEGVQGVIQAVMIVRGVKPEDLGSNRVSWASDLAGVMRTVLDTIEKIGRAIDAIVPSAKRVGESISLGMRATREFGSGFGGVVVAGADMALGGALTAADERASVKGGSRWNSLVEMAASDARSSLRNILRDASPSRAPLDSNALKAVEESRASTAPAAGGAAVNLYVNGGRYPMQAEKSVADRLRAELAATGRASD